ncbi:acyl-CoA thioesterase [Montanilutibacter psychrotolerans]|uniref:Acyl-CoA thioesterase n=1 Tax=Montanilutibacter psychrotolerans TaxID=1327343 RepID=A0A3M8SMS8_9GAMM|nr:acyl-CoA thioesterase [Lysobacter psychrotolerans]RNF82597.1 acyl-CoA thioesterase [Lysobacter psychrotolerans]
MSGQQRELTLRFLAQPTDVNYGGKVHGGMVMKWIDQAGYAAAVGWSGKYCVTVAVGGIRFVAPIRISDLVTVHTKLIHTGTSSMHFAVEVTARDPGLDEAATAARLCTHCVIVFVAVDPDHGTPVPVPAWTPDSDSDRRLAEYALKVMALSKDIEQVIQRLDPAPGENDTSG